MLEYYNWGESIKQSSLRGSIHSKWILRLLYPGDSIRY